MRLHRWRVKWSGRRPAEVALECVRCGTEGYLLETVATTSPVPTPYWGPSDCDVAVAEAVMRA